MAQEMLLSQIREHKSIFLILVCFLVFTMEARAISDIDYFEFINDLKSFQRPSNSIRIMKMDH